MAASSALTARSQAFVPPATGAHGVHSMQADRPHVAPIASLAAIPAHASVQRECGACAADEAEGMPVQPRLQVGRVDDRYEREADTIAGQVMAMRDEDVSSTAPVQPACSACSSSPGPSKARRAALGEAQESGNEPVRGRSDPDHGGTETIDASPGELTAGGSPLPTTTRNFFEDRMGRDLSDVRVHQGREARQLSGSIAARAFTYRNHVWLGAGERTSPGFTMAHELAHVLQQTTPGPVGPQPRRVAQSATRERPTAERGRVRAQREPKAGLAQAKSGTLTDSEIAAIVFNEVRSLSGPGIECARVNVAHAVMNGDESGEARPKSAPLSAKAPEVEKSVYAGCESAVTMARTERSFGMDSTAGAVHFNLRANNSTADFKYGGKITTQSGPFDNSYTKELPAKGIYVNTYLKAEKQQAKTVTSKKSMKKKARKGK